MRRFAKSVGSFLISLLVFLVLLEAGSFIAIKAGWLDVTLPDYSIAGADRFWKIINRDFGVWHEPNDTIVHDTRCFDVVYRSNSFGMRDAEVTKAAEGHRIVVLGDSFVEGWGVDYGERFTEILERNGEVELLNFGAAGSFGSTQSYVLYKTFASEFAHDAVIFAILPDNDFIDDSPRREDLDYGPWRPFLVGDYPDYALTYPERDFEADRGLWAAVDVFLEQLWITYRVAKYAIAYNAELRDQRREQHGEAYYSGYYDFGENQFRRLKYAIEQIAVLAAPRPMLVVTIPRPSDFRRANETGREPPIRRKLARLAEELGITYVDLMPAMADDPDRAGLFHACDGHWSPKGHAKAAEIIGSWRYFASW